MCINIIGSPIEPLPVNKSPLPPFPLPMYPSICLLTGSCTWLVIQCSIKAGSLLTWGAGGGRGSLEYLKPTHHTKYLIPNTKPIVPLLFWFIGIQVPTLVWINANDFPKTLSYPMFSSEVAYRPFTKGPSYWGTLAPCLFCHGACFLCYHLRPVRLLISVLGAMCRSI